MQATSTSTAQLGLTAVIDPPTTRWAGRTVLLVYLWGFISAVVVMGMLLGQRLVRWCREKGGW